MKLFIYKMLSLVLGLLAVELLLTFAGFSYNFIQRTQNPIATEKTKDTKVILCLGESTTAWGLSDSYPAQLQNILNANYGPGKYLVINEGESATDSSIILSGLEKKIAHYQPDIIITMMGINDYWRLSNENHWYSNLKLYQLLHLIKINSPKLFERFSKPNEAITAPKSNVEIVETLVFENTNYGSDFYEAESIFFQKNYALAYEKLLSVYKKNTKSSKLSFYLAVTSLELGYKDKGLQYFKEFADLQKTTAAYNYVGEYYYNKFGVFDSVNQQHAHYFLKKSLEINPKSFSALKHLGCSYVNNLTKQPELRQQSFDYLNLAVSISLQDADAIACLADLYISEEKLEKAVEILTSGLHLTEGSAFFIRTRLIETYIKLKDYANAEKILTLTKKQFEFNPRLQALESEINSRHNSKPSRSFQITAANFYEHSETQSNYKKLARTISQKNIIHVVLQYPLRPIQPIKKTLSEFPNIVFIENSENFKSALTQKKYDELFIDNFAGDFGHFTAFGAGMISENIFKRLKEEKVFN